MKRYLTLYINKYGKPDSRIILSGEPPTQSWGSIQQGFRRRTGTPAYYRWFIDLDANPPQVFQPARDGKDLMNFMPSFDIWQGRLPDQWLNSQGDLYNKQGKLVFTYNSDAP